jgi:hypothetical protein
MPSRTPAHLAALSFVRGSETRSSKTVSDRNCIAFKSFAIGLATLGVLVFLSAGYIDYIVNKKIDWF